MDAQLAPLGTVSCRLNPLLPAVQPIKKRDKHQALERNTLSKSHFASFSLELHMRNYCTVKTCLCVQEGWEIMNDQIPHCESPTTHEEECPTKSPWHPTCHQGACLHPRFPAARVLHRRLMIDSNSSWASGSALWEDGKYNGKMVGTAAALACHC